MGAIILSSLLLATAQAPSAQIPSVTPPAKQTLQQKFDAASELSLNNHCTEAVAAFEELERNPAAMKVAIVRAATALRKGICLVAIGRSEEGGRAVQDGLPLIAKAGENFADDVVRAHLALGKAARNELDYSRAADEFRVALASPEESNRFLALFGLAQVTLFDKGPEPIAYIDEAMQILAKSPATTKDATAQLMTLKARILLNRGDFEGGYTLLKDALKLQGGLTTRVALTDIITRSDLAIAAMLVKRPDDARKYLAYTGAGLADQAPFAVAENMESPLCGAAGNLSPEDRAVVEFSIGDDGTAVGVQPIYTTGGRDAAMAFAQAASEWSWNADKVKEIKPFFRSVMRVEMRCSTVGARPSVTDPVKARFMGWAASQWKGTVALDNDRDLAANAMTLTEGVRTAGDDNATVALLAALAGDPLIGSKQAAAYLDEALAVAQRGTVPAPAANWLRIAKIQKVREARKDWSNYSSGLRQALSVVAATNDNLATNAVRLMLAEPSFQHPAPADAPALLDAVIADATLAEGHPFKVNALLQRATLAAQANDFALAQKSFERTGLSTEQCAFIGASPAMRRNGASSADYPEEAFQMGFEGWVRLEFDIDAVGHTRDQRALIAYPPFVFVNAATKLSQNFLYENSYRPGGATTCAGARNNVNFRMHP